MPTQMNFHQLRIFYMVARVGSFSRAAQQLGISQPAVSIQVREMERALGTPLFIRRRGDHQLTETGRIAFDYARRLFALSDEMEQVLDDLQGVRAGTLTLGASTTPGEYILPPLIGRFQQRYPGVEVSLHIANSQQIVQQVQRRELDLALVGAQVRDAELVVEPYIQDEIVVIAAPSHPLARETGVPVKALESQPFTLREEGSATRRTAEAYLQGRGVQVKGVVQLSSNEAMKRAVAAGSTLGFISRLALGPELAANLLAILPVQGWACTRPLSIVYRQDKHLTSAQQAFLSFLQAERTEPAPEAPVPAPRRRRGRRPASSTAAPSRPSRRRPRPASS